MDLLETCINQEIDTVSRIGSSCLQQLIEQNVEKFEPSHWKIVTSSIEHLFEVTTATELFGDYSDSDDQYDHNENTKDITTNGSGPGGQTGSRTASGSSITGHRAQNSSISAINGAAVEDLQGSPGSTISDEVDSKSSPKSHKRATSWTEYNQTRQNRFRKTIMKCILQLLMIDTVDEILQNKRLSIPTSERIVTVLVSPIHPPKTLAILHQHLWFANLSRLLELRYMKRCQFLSFFESWYFYAKALSLRIDLMLIRSLEQTCGGSVL